MIQYVKRVFSVLILGTLIVVCDANSANMCIKDDVVAVVLDSLINGSSSSYVADTKSWSVSFSYGAISGIGGCYSNVCSTQGCIATNQNISPYSTGYYCYCKMLLPVPSKWVYSGRFNGGNADNCAAQCASYCSNNSKNNSELRKGMFGSIGR